MGNRESTTEEEQDAPQNDNSTSPKIADIDNLTYRDLYGGDSESEEEGTKDDPLFNEYDEDTDSGSSINASQMASNMSVISNLRPFTASISFTLSYVQGTATLSVQLTGTTNIPGKGHGGASEYQLLLAVVPSETAELESKLRNGPNPTFDDIWLIQIPRMQLPHSSLRFRLYGCRYGTRIQLVGEKVLFLAEVNLRSPMPMTLKLTSECEPTPTIDPIKFQIYSNTLTVPQTATSRLASQALPIQEFHEPEAKNFRASLAELLLNASYNLTTGEFECVIQKAVRVYVPGYLSENPNTYIHLQFSDENGKLMAQAKSVTVKKIKNPTFNETFVFSILKTQIDHVSLIVTAYHRKRGQRKKIRIGSFSMGKNCTSEVERQHWDEIVSSKGERVARWHKFYMDTVS